QSLVDALASHLRALGGEIRTAVRVASLRELPPSRALLFDVTARQLAEIAGDELPAKFVNKLTSFRYGPGVFKIDFALDGPIPWTSRDCHRAATVHVGGTMDEIAAHEAAVSRGHATARPFVL